MVKYCTYYGTAQRRKGSKAQRNAFILTGRKIALKININLNSGLYFKLIFSSLSLNPCTVVPLSHCAVAPLRINFI